jgi:hypothetical protein
MSRKTKQIFEEGSIKEIYRLFILPLNQYKPPEYNLQHWHNELFGNDVRTLTPYRVKAPFKMPGLLYERPFIKVQGIGYRDVKEDQELMVRFDLERNNEIDVEYFGGQGQREQVFCLSNEEWSYIRQFLQKMK